MFGCDGFSLPSCIQPCFDSLAALGNIIDSICTNIISVPLAVTIEPCMVQTKRLSCDVSLQTTENSSIIVTDDLVEYASYWLYV